MITKPESWLKQNKAHVLVAIAIFSFAFLLPLVEGLSTFEALWPSLLGFFLLFICGFVGAIRRGVVPIAGGALRFEEYEKLRSELTPFEKRFVLYAIALMLGPLAALAVITLSFNF